MKRIQFVAAVMLLCCITTNAQESDYQPLVREGVKWVNHSQFIYYGDTPYFGPIQTEALQFSGEKVITTPSGTHTYKKIQGENLIYMRESEKKVYLLDRVEMYDEIVIYDFSKPDTAIYNSGYGFEDSFVLCDMVEIEGKQCRVFKSKKQNSSYLVESIGLVSKTYGDLIHTSMLPYAGGASNYYCHLDHVEDLDGNIIYKAPWYEEPAQCKPLVREGVVWHYAFEDFELDEEGMIDMSTYRLIDQKMEFLGDTTIYGITYKKCFMYETDQMASDEQPILLAREENGKVIFAPISFENWNNEYIYHPEGTLPGPYSGVRGEYITYDFGDMAGFLSKLQANGWGPTLESTSRTLVGADSVYCYRTNAGLYVESVGFDGDYSGYLDDPFPIRPTCICPGVKGLIMVADSKGDVLYKGRYYNEAVVYPCDITGDGKVDIADVNAVINVMLGKGTNSLADVTRDGVVDIADINAIINVMLGK